MRHSRRTKSRSVRRVVAIQIDGFDHLVLCCADVEMSLRYYVDELGMAPVRVDEWRGGTVPFPSVRVSDDVVIDLVEAGDTSPGRNVDHFCLVAPASTVSAIAADGDRFRLQEGPVPRFGARGTGTSVYLLDPDDNTIEVRTYQSLD